MKVLTATRMRFVLFTIASLLAGWRQLVAQGVARPAISRDSLQHIVSERVKAGRAPGLVVGVIGPNGARVVAMVGEARPGVPVAESTIFEIGSITKAFTGLLLAEMVRRGEVRLDQPVAELLTAGARVPERNGKAITLEHLSVQNSGLPRLPDNLKPADPSNPYADYTVAQLHDFLVRHELRRDPGAQYEYSNLGVGLLGHALALRAGTSYETLLFERVLEPLGMANTGITMSGDMRASAANGHSPDGDVVPWWDLPTLAGAGALRSNLHDMLIFLAANMQPADTPLGRAIAMSQERRFRVNGSLTMGLNWHITTFRGDTLVFHNGGTGGFRSMLAWNPGTQTGVIILGNMSQDNEDIVRHILLGTPLAIIASRTEVQLPREVLASYVGRYELAPTFVITVTHDDGMLFAQATDQPRFRVFAEARDRLFYKVVDAQLEFTRDAAGKVTSLTLVQNGARNPGRRLPD